MIAIQKSQTISHAIPPLQGERAGVRVSYPPAQPPTENPNGVQSFSPGLLRAAAATLGGTSQNPTVDFAAARSAKFICGYPIRLIHPIPSYPKSTVDLGLERPDTTLSPTCHKPKIRPQNKGIKPNSGRYKPKKSSSSHVDYT